MWSKTQSICSNYIWAFIIKVLYLYSGVNYRFGFEPPRFSMDFGSMVLTLLLSGLICGCLTYLTVCVVDEQQGKHVKMTKTVINVANLSPTPFVCKTCHQQFCLCKNWFIEQIFTKVLHCYLACNTVTVVEFPNHDVENHSKTNNSLKIVLENILLHPDNSSSELLNLSSTMVNPIN